MTMIIAPNSPVRRKEGAQGEGKEKAGDRRKGGHTGTPTPGAEARANSVRGV